MTTESATESETSALEVDSPSLLYRFRPLSRVLDDGELEKQEIYFASPSQLNDPMEGFRDIFWRGDLIAWQNLFKHYIRCLEVSFTLAKLLGESEEITWAQIPIVGPFVEEDSLPREASLQRVFRVFLGQEAIGEVLSFLASRELPVSREELKVYLSTLHMFAMSALWTEFEEQGLEAQGSGIHVREAGGLSLTAARELVKHHAQLLGNDGRPGRMRALFAAQGHVSYQMGLVDSMLAREGLVANRDFLFRRFPAELPDQLDRLIYPEWRVACFMAQARDASLWGTYGDSHKGVCLVFKPSVDGGRATLPLRRVIGRGSSGAIWGVARGELLKVQYTKRFPEIDFFRSIGRLPVGQLHKHWHSDGQELRSACAPNDEAEWRAAYWQAFYPGITTKLEDWARKREFRIILSGLATDFSNPYECKANYDFENLAGLVFGMRTPVADKLAIVKIIVEKCRTAARNDFKFYDAQYSESTGRFEHVELPLLAKAF